MQLSEIKDVRDQFGSDWREIVDQSVNYAETDFEVGNYRFISSDAIDDILVEELESDPYVLGCFTAWAIHQATDWPMALIEACQKAEQFEALGQAIIKEGYTGDLADVLVTHDGYGHHFNRYDGSEEELELGGETYYAFWID